MNSKISFSRPVRLEISGGSVPGGKLPADLRHALGDELPGAVVVGVGLELDRDLGDAELGVRADAPHVRQTRERHLERNGDGRLELLGAHRRVLRDHVEDRRGEIGEHVAPAGPGARSAPIDGAGRDQQRGQRAARGTTSRMSRLIMARLSGHRGRLRPSRPAP